MSDKTYHIVHAVGSSDKSIEDAIQGAITDTEKKHAGLKWFEVVETRGHIRDGKVGHFQVTVKLGYTD